MPTPAAHYIAELPSLTIDEHIAPFFTKFYQISDNPDAHEDYARSFTDNATVIMGLRKVEGYKDILTFRHSLWSGPVKARRHDISKIFPFGDNSNEVMIYGTVNYTLKNDKKVTVEWAGHAVMAQTKPREPGEGWKMSFYQVYMDAGAVAEAMK